MTDEEIEAQCRRVVELRLEDDSVSNVWQSYAVLLRLLDAERAGRAETRSVLQRALDAAVSRFEKAERERDEAVAKLAHAERLRASLQDALDDCTSIEEERDAALAKLAAAERVVEAARGRHQCWEHADACCADWCDSCRAQKESDEVWYAALAAYDAERAEGC